MLKFCTWKEEEEGTVVEIMFGKSRQSVIPCLQSVAADTARFWMSQTNEMRNPQTNAADSDAYACRESVMG